MAKKADKKYIPRLRLHYYESVVPAMIKESGYKNRYEVPRLEKIVLNMGIGNAKEDANQLQNALNDLGIISGQKAVVTSAKRAISNFKIRVKDPVGARVTLRGDRMYDFLDRFIALVSPRIRDFRGLSGKSFDGRGNYNFGVTEQIIFPEIDYDKIDHIRGLNISIVTTAETDEGSYDLLNRFGFPFKQRPGVEQNVVGVAA